jgi:Zn-dependent protease with chaperone function
MATSLYYPPNPTSVPPDLTRPDADYRKRVVAMIAGLFVFLVIYLGIIVLAAYLAYFLFNLPVDGMRNARGRSSGYGFIIVYGGGIAAILLCLFLIKGLFKGQRVERSGYLELSEKDHPELFAFIRQVYQDVGAPKPSRVYASADVNAALIYNTSLLNLIVPPRKDLLIGLGLVNVVSLDEFKAVLAHEFGHFAQRSVGLGNYLYIANKVMNDVIYSRDGFDSFLDAWARIDIRLGAPAWALKAVLWLVRKLLSTIYETLNVLHLSLSRQMEFNADNVAVSVTGSDSLIHGLYRLSFANDCLADTAKSLEAAADHGKFSDDIYYHQTQSAIRLRKQPGNERAGLPAALPVNPKEPTKLFEPTDDGIPEKYRSHPTDDMREKNAKRYYLRSTLDERSPWLLFGENAAALKKAMSTKFYQHSMGRAEKLVFEPAEQVQQFIDAEHAESTFDPKYHGLYDDRFIEPKLTDNSSAPVWEVDKIVAWLSNWPQAELKNRMETYNQRIGEYQLLRGLASGDYTLKGRTFKLRDRDYEKNDIDGLHSKVDREIENDTQDFHEWDRQVFLANRSIAIQLDRREQSTTPRRHERELMKRYEFHTALQKLQREILNEKGRLHSVLGNLSANTQLSPEDFQALRATLADVRDQLIQNLNASKSYQTPAFTNVEAGSSLYTLVLDRGDTDLPAPSGDSISGEWIGKLLQRIEGVLSRLNRVRRKSLGSLLEYQESLKNEWQKANETASVGNVDKHGEG